MTAAETERRFWIAVGDSFTAGTGDDPGHGGWVRRTASTLIDRGQLDELRSYAVPGVRLAHVLDQQIPRVGLTGRATIISAIAGANDLLRAGCDLAAVAGQVDQVLDWALANAEIVLATNCPNFVANRPATLRRLGIRIDTLNDHVEKRCRDAGGRIRLVDAYRSLADPELWTDDGLHANAAGHQRLAEAAEAALNGSS